MMSKAQDDDLVMSLTQLVLDQPADQRELYLRKACSGDAELFAEVWNYVDWENRMQGFLLEPLCEPVAADRQLQPGEILDGRFRIVREVAQGGMGIVYEAIDERLGKRIALKCAKSGFRQRLSPEVRHASEISHPNVCRTFEIHTASTPRGEMDFLTMEFLEGETLTDRLGRGRLAKAEYCVIAMQICQGLAEAHRHHVVHGDLKSNNVILTHGLDGSARAVITDFGLAHGSMAVGENAPGNAGSGEAGGAPDYMAPELWRGGMATPASDVYALGVILYELATGKRPFAGASWQSIQKAPAPGKLPPAHSKWDRILARCLDPDPAKRFPDAVQVAQALEPSRTRRWWLAAAASIILAAGVGAVTYERATTPPESIKLAVLPLQAAPEGSVAAANLSQEISRELGRLKGGKRARLTVIPLARATQLHVSSAEQARSALGATHVLQGKLTLREGSFRLHALLTDARSQANDAQWDFTYAPSELSYAPLAMAGIATATLRLPPLAPAGVNTAARNDYLAGLAYMRQNSTIDQALPLLRHAVEVDAGSPLTWSALAEAQWYKYYATKNAVWLDRTSESLRQAQRRDLDLPQVHQVNGLLRANAGAYELAETEYQRSIELDPNDGQTYLRLGQVYEKANRLDKALSALRKAVSLQPQSFRVHLQLGAFYLEHGNLAIAVQHFETSVRLRPNEPQGHFALGTAYSHQGRWDQAEFELRKATVPGGPASAFNNLASALIKRGKDREAVPVLLSALQQFKYGDRYLWWMNLGDAYRRTNQPDESIHAYREGLEAADTEMGKNTREGIVRSYLAYLLARLDNRTRAHSEINQALSLLPEDKDILLTAAWTYEAMGERDHTLTIVENLPDEALAEAARSPNLADLRNDSRFKELLLSRHIK